MRFVVIVIVVMTIIKIIIIVPFVIIIITSDRQASIPSEMMPAMRPLLDLARASLWHWRTFPIILPTPITVQVF